MTVTQTAIVPPIRQKVFALSSAHYPSRDRMGDPCLESRAELGRQRCRYRLGDVFAQQSMRRLAPALGMSSGSQTCWLINKIPISFLSVVNLSKASSIAALSVLLSTTRKFFCESGGCVTCYISIRIVREAKLGDIVHQFQLGGDQSLSPVKDISTTPGGSRMKRAYFISDDCKELSILVGRGWGCHDRVVCSVVKPDGFSELELYESWEASLRRHPASHFRANEAPL